MRGSSSLPVKKHITAAVAIASNMFCLSVLCFIGLSSVYANNDSATRGVAATDQEQQQKIDEVLALNADTDYGEYLAGECQTCHTDGGSAEAVPAINGLPAAYIIKALLEYKDGTRDNQVMRLMAANLGDEELASLAAYFSSKTE